MESNEIHSTVYLPLLSVAMYLGSGLTKTALSQHLKILQIASAVDCGTFKCPYAAIRLQTPQV